MNPGRCFVCSEYCTTCEEVSGNVICLECFQTFQMVNGKCLCDPEDYFLSENTCNIKYFTLNDSSEANMINLYFTKYLLNNLNPSYLDIKYPLEIDSSFITYSIVPIQTGYSYSLLFSYSENIDQTFIIEIKFSDDVLDRQFIHLSINPIQTNLRLYNQEEDVEYGCHALCSEFYVDICTKCIDYAYLDDVKCVCYSGINLDNICKTECPEGMKIDEDLRTCILCDVSCMKTSSNETSESELSEYSPQEIEEARQYSEVSSSISNASTSTSLFLSFLTSSLDNAWSLMNTIQIFTYLPLIGIKLPLNLKESLRSQDNANKVSELFKDYLPKGQVPYQIAYESGYKTGLFLYNSAKPILIFMGILISNMVICLLHKISKGKVKDVLGKILSIIWYGAYLRYFLQMYMDLAVSVFIQVLTVIYI